MSIGYREIELRSVLARVLAVLVVAACAAAEVGLVVYGVPDRVLRGTPALALVAVGAWSLFWLPRVRVSPAEVELVNPLRTVSVRWPAILDVRTRWGLELETTQGRFSAWAATRSGAIGAGRDARLAVRRREIGASAPAEDTIRDAASAASVVVQRQWSEYRDAGLLGTVEGAGVEIRYHGRLVVVLILLAVGCVGAVLLP